MIERKPKNGSDTTCSIANEPEKLHRLVADVELIDLREPMIRSAIAALPLPPASQGLDVGCGCGWQTLALAETIGEHGRVTGIDISDSTVQSARKLVREMGRESHIVLQTADACNLPFADNTFDWAWSSDCVGYVRQNSDPMMEEVVRTVRPGGHIAISGWSSELLLPGFPVLEARLNATVSGMAPFQKGDSSNQHFLRLLNRFRNLGIENRTARTFVHSIHAPLASRVRRMLIKLLHMRWFNVEKELPPDDLALYRRLCDPESPDFIVDHTDYFAFFTYSMFTGRVAKEP